MWFRCNRAEKASQGKEGKGDSDELRLSVDYYREKVQVTFLLGLHPGVGEPGRSNILQVHYESCGCLSVAHKINKKNRRTANRRPKVALDSILRSASSTICTAVAVYRHVLRHCQGGTIEGQGMFCQPHYSFAHYNCTAPYRLPTAHLCRPEKNDQ